jgi:predicted SprT family Zn-dependent metalloprotease
MKRDAMPTREQFAAYEKMFSYFNAKLFHGELPACLLNFSRRTKTHGFFAPSRWERGREVRHEISLNPATLKSRKPSDVAGTLVHEMVHLWQQEFGRPSRAGYHNAEWAEKMEAVGLVPSDTAAPGGAKTGQKVSHYIEKAGAFALAFRAMPKEYVLPWACEEPEDPLSRKQKLAKTKIKYTCPACGVNVWGKPELSISCDDCEEPFEVAS